ncbi:hypothetical protein R1flu_011955 [Riccia fluitans]|uniref:Uncharacterized protein n=1 Tax=Riccia fluitans TaxID=41844 RepID=A0ABD1Z993_9MARC
MASYNDVFYDDDAPSWLTAKEDDSEGRQQRNNCVLGFSVFCSRCSTELCGLQFSGDVCFERRAEQGIVSATKNG